MNYNMEFLPQKTFEFQLRKALLDAYNRGRSREERETMHSTNPFVRIRRESGMSQARWAMSLGVPVSGIYHAEYGGPKSPPQAILDALEAAGYDSRTLAREYLSWRRAQAGPVQVAR